MSDNCQSADERLALRTGEQLAAALPGMLHRAFRLRVYDRRGKIEAIGKRRHRSDSSLLLDLTQVDTVLAIAAGLRLRPDSEITDWMQSVDLWLEFTDERGLTIVMLGLIRPGWLHWHPYGDLQLAAPEALEELLSPFGLNRGSC